jgi:hypothetical protein
MHGADCWHANPRTKIAARMEKTVFDWSTSREGSAVRNTSAIFISVRPARCIPHAILTSAHGLRKKEKSLVSPWHNKNKIGNRDEWNIYPKIQLCGLPWFIEGRAIAQAVSHWFPTAAARVRARSLIMWDLWWRKWSWGRFFFPSTSVSPAHLHSTNCSTVTIIYHLGLVQYARSGRNNKWTQSHPTNNNNNN